MWVGAGGFRSVRVRLDAGECGRVWERAGGCGWILEVVGWKWWVGFQGCKTIHSKPDILGGGRAGSGG